MGETAGLILAIYLSVAVPTACAMFGHLWGTKDLHVLDRIVVSVLAGALWWLWLFRR